MPSWGLTRLICTSILLAAATVSYGQIDIEKDAREANPTLVLSRFQGPPETKKLLLATLKRCDWFAVSESAEKPDFVVSAQHDTGSQTLVLQVTSSRRGSMSLRASGSAGDTTALVHSAVDQLLKKTFSVPGMCASRIAFAVGGKGNQKEIFTCRFDGSDARRLTHNGNISTEPSWSANGRFLVYTIYRNNATGVVLVDMDSNRQRQISHFRGLNAGADLSPDGKWAALSLSKERRVDLYLTSLTGKTLRQITNDFAVESSPSWSPRGDKLCYVSDRAGRPQLYVVAATGGTPTRLLRDRDEAVSPDWSPVSNRICFSTRLDGQYVIAVTDMADASRKRKIVTRAAGDWESPSWAPDGRHVVCSRSSRGRRELYQVDTWHGRMIPITQNGDHSLPAWSTLQPGGH